MTTNNFYKKAPPSDGFKLQVSCRVPQSVHDRLRDLAHSERFTSFSAFLETALTNYDNNKKTLQELETMLKSGGEVFEKGLTGLQNEAKETTELRYFFYNILMDALEIDIENRKQINAELLGDRDKENLIQILKEAVPEFQETEWEDTDTVKTITFSQAEIDHINTILKGRIEIGSSTDIYHFIRQCIDYTINASFNKKSRFSIPDDTPEFFLDNAFYKTINNG